MKNEEKERRAQNLIWMIILAVLLLLARLGYLQLALGDELETAARTQRLRQIPIPAPRGEIRDRNGITLATNEPSYTATLVYTGKSLRDETVAELSRILGISTEAIRAAERELRPTEGRPYLPVVLKVNLTQEEYVALEMRRSEMPGVVVDVQPIRRYPGLPGFAGIGGTLASHVLGYVGKGDNDYDIKGVTGLEGAFDRLPDYVVDSGGFDPKDPPLGLKGVNGVRQVEVDSGGRPIHVIREEAPQEGNDLILTIDARLQAAAERALQERMLFLRETEQADGPFPAPYGAVVAIDVKTGGILAMASEPDFDPNVFALGAYALRGTEASREFARYYESLEEAEGKPLYNHAALDGAAPGSTFKPIVAVAALEEEVTTAYEEIADSGVFRLGGQSWADWRPGGHGSVNLVEAIGRSCNIYFYTMGNRLGIEPIAATARQFGLGRSTGLRDLTGGEYAGVVPSPEAKAELFQALGAQPESWYPGDTINASIGQGYQAYTPLQMASYAATLANGGKRYRTHVVKEIRSPDGRTLWEAEPELLGEVEARPETLAKVREGMLGVTTYNPGWRGVDSNYGTAYSYFADFPEKAKRLTGREIYVAGKTGTAEVAGKPNDGWFIGFAPYDDPEIAIAVYIRSGGGGSLAGAPVARTVFEEYFGMYERPEPSAPPIEERLYYDGPR